MSLLLVEETPVLGVPAARSWDGEISPRWRPAPAPRPASITPAATPTSTPRPAVTPTSTPVPAPRNGGLSRTSRAAASRAALHPAAPAAPAPAAPVEEPAAPVPAKTAMSRLADLALTLAAVLGLVVLGITVTAHTTGLRPLVVKSGSMEPTIPTGAMVLVRTIPAADISVGDVVAVERPDRTRVTHRVLAVEQLGATASLTLKGDANEDPDPVPVVVAEAGKLVLSAPAIGRVPAFLASAKGGFVLGCLFTTFVLPLVRRRDGTP